MNTNTEHNFSSVVIGLSGGLGNQIFQYAAGRSLALRLSVPLTLDVSWFLGNKDRRYALKPFDIKGETRIWNPELPDFLNHLESKITRRFSNKRMGALIYREPHFHYDPAFGQIDTPVFLEGYWQSPRYFNSHAKTITNDLTMKQPISAKCQELLTIIKSCDAICLHIRRGDYISNPTTASTHGSCSLAYYHDSVARLMKDLNQPHCFIFSDDPDWVRRNIDLPCLASVVDINGTDDAHLDLMLMAACKHYVIANSSLSWWGAWLGRASDKKIIAPKKWFNTPTKDTKDLIPLDWERL